MQRSTKIAVAVVLVAVIVSAGVYTAYEFSTPANPCAGISTPAGPRLNTSTLPSGPAVGPQLHPRIPSGATTAGSIPRSARAPARAPSNFTIVINVVAAENFWGSLVSQLGGTHVNVTSIISDPNVDPHEYQSNDSDAIAIKNAQYVILNNVGYDDWASALISADGDTNQTVLNIGDSLGVSVTGGIVTGNPHQWYNPAYVLQAVAWMYDNLTAISPSLSGYFTEQYHNLTASLDSLYSEVATIKDEFAGTVVASTESIFVYLANATGLDLVSPPAFMEAIAEGNDPPDQSVVQFQCQLESGHVRVLVFNAQTVTPITTTMKEIAQSNNVTVMSVTETIVPPGATFQQWMGGQLNALYVALEAPVLGE
jgi:zinc/manganese transport system substrate-binding protein